MQRKFTKNQQLYGELKSTPSLPWEAQVNVIAPARPVTGFASSLHEMRSARTYQVKVEAVLDNKNVQITPAGNDIPSGVEVKLISRIQNEIPDTNYLQHVGLDWQILIDQKLVSQLKLEAATISFPHCADSFKE